MSDKIPRFISQQFAGGAREFRANHRRMLRAALVAVREARMGCAYSPAFDAIREATAALEKAIEAARPANWERTALRKARGGK